MAAPANFFLAYLATALSAGTASSTVVLDRITTLDGQTIETGDFADLGRGVLTVNPEGDGLTSYPENISFTAVTAATKTLSGCIRGLDKSGSTDTDLMRYHPVGTPVILSFGSHQIQDILGYADDLVAAATIGSSVVTLASAGETVAAGDLVYLKNDGLWWLTDADTVATVEGVQLGIAQGAGTAGNAITNGVMLRGLDTNQSGLVAGTTYYASNTAGDISSSAGTTSRVIGIAKSTTSLYFDPYYINALNSFYSSTVGFKTISVFTFGETISVGDALYLKASDQKVYKTDADASDTTAPFVGFAFEAGSANDVRKVQTRGVVTGLSGLTAGTDYWLSGTAGALSSTAGTFAYRVGTALSTTSLFINPGKMNPVTRKYVIGDSPATWTKPTGLKYIDVEIVGGGGGSGGTTDTYRGSGGGGGGEYARKRIAASALGATETVTIGAAGAAGAAAAGSGGAGGTTSFGSHVTAVGGNGGTAGASNATAAGGAGGTGGTGSDEAIPGGNGGNGVGDSSAAGSAAIGGAGGSSSFGRGAPANPAVNTDANAGAVGTGYGAGASGSANANSTSDAAGAAGTAGYCRVTEYF